MATHDLCTLEDIRSQFRAPVEDSQLVESLISAASRTIMRHPRVQREFAPQTAAATRDFQATGRIVDLAPYDLRVATTVTLHPEDGAPDVLVAGTDYMLAPVGGSLGGTYLRLVLGTGVGLSSTFASSFGGYQLRILGDWGIWETASVDDDVRRACAMTVASWLDRSASGYNVPDVDEGQAFGPDRAQTWAVPTAALQLLAPWSRVTVD